MFRIRSLDILKGIAMIMVIMVHLEQSFDLCKWFYYFQQGCPIFFVCSGFGIATLICRRYPLLNSDKIELKRYYFSRFKALAPGWYLAMIFIFGINSIMLLFTGRTLSFGSNRNPMAILINIAFLHGLVPSCNNNVMPGGWYIGTTAILYSITPLILSMMNKSKSRKFFFLISSAVGGGIWLSLLFLKDYFYSLNQGFLYFIFLVHYPEYLLGIILYYDLNENLLLKEWQIKICFLLGVIGFLVSFALFYSSLPYGNILSAWTTGLATYFVLYNLIIYERVRKESCIGKLLASYGKNSYGIYLLHSFICLPFVEVIEKIVNKFGLSIKNVFGFLIMIPIALVLCYIIGVIFNRIVKNISKLVFII